MYSFCCSVVFSVAMLRPSLRWGTRLERPVPFPQIA
jgi:hypothetical protein